ncbi:hypothetical protein H5183_10880 [Pseudoalteromonas sp. SR44-8]|uniref:hypothetical protein n=1 Tax=Pseudoalteromonas sp. SR44-8 TaxID=2760933 RepID=UPI0016015532|nr:hypothetical protein [Pseudoalteromonas sp. SR44-8]MBB1301846.1 hypothetical protein [Pseudoalteromonas sp. SR44-8]
MFKHIIASSIQAAFVGALLIILISLPAFGGVATIFGFIAFPIAIMWCLILAYPLIKLRQKFRLPEYAYFAIYLFTGFVLGALTPVLMFGVTGTIFSIQSVTFLGLYGLFGAACAITAWNYVRKNVSL